jgi:hypothetical protein
MSASADVFEFHRARLFGVAYRMLGSRSDAEDLLQDAYLRWHQSDRTTLAPDSDQPHGKESIMFSKREVTEPKHATPKRMRLAVFVAVAATLAGVFAYVAPASNADRALLDDRPGIANNATIGPWGEDLSEGAVDSGGIETDLDGNASALFASDWCGLPACGNPRQP